MKNLPLLLAYFIYTAFEYEEMQWHRNQNALNVYTLFIKETKEYKITKIIHRRYTKT